MRKHGGTPSRRDKHVTLAAISPPGVARGRFVGGQQSGLAGSKPPPLFTCGATSCSSQGRRQGEPWGASPRPSAPTYLPLFGAVVWCVLLLSVVLGSCAFRRCVLSCLAELCVFCCGVLLRGAVRRCALCRVRPGVSCCAFPVLPSLCGVAVGPCSPLVPCSPVSCPVVLCCRVVVWCPVLMLCLVCFLRLFGFFYLKNRCKIC